MAKSKRPQLDTNQAAGLFRKTEPARAEGQPEGEEQQPDPVKPRGIGLKESEWKRLEEIGQELGGETSHALAMWAIRDFMRRYEAGEIRLQTQTKRTLPGM